MPVFTTVSPYVSGYQRDTETITLLKFEWSAELGLYTTAEHLGGVTFRYSRTDGGVWAFKPFNNRATLSQRAASLAGGVATIDFNWGQQYTNFPVAVPGASLTCLGSATVEFGPGG